MRRIWWYGKDDWDGSRWKPLRASDEYGRRTIVIPMIAGFLVWAYRYCYCADCGSVRLDTAYSQILGEAHDTALS